MNIPLTIIIILVIVVLVLFGIYIFTNESDKKEVGSVNETIMEGNEISFIDDREDLYQTAILAGGCFWCIETAFEHLDGVVDVVSGYTGGNVEDPTYRQVSNGSTGHYEAVKITFNPLRISYLNLLEIFFTQIDPTDNGGQFADRGSQYKTAVFYINDEQKRAAKNYIDVLSGTDIYGNDIVTEVLPESVFYLAEEYHQDYADNNKYNYERYAQGSGRKSYISSLWKNIDTIGEILKGKKYLKPSDEELRKILNELQYSVTQEDGTERAFQNEYYDNHEDGIYVDIVSGEPLFSSTDKFESGTGWPSFTKPIAPENIVYEKDDSLVTTRIAVSSKYADSHLGHVFNDGVEDTGVRYCMNSAALRFISKSMLEQEGYSQYLYLFE